MKTKLFLIMLAFLFATAVRAQLSEKWRVIDTASTTNSEQGIDVASDASGNVYVVGKKHNGTDYDIYLVKYNSSGQKQWSRTIDGGGNDIPIGVEVDASGNAYVGGNSMISGVNKMTAVKYSPLGVQRYHYTSAATLGSTAYGMALNGPMLHLAGNIKTTTTNTDAYVVKLGSLGGVMWSQNYDSLTLDQANDIKVRATNGNVYITGQVGTSRFVTIRYDSLGVLQWSRTSTSGTSANKLAIGGLSTTFAVYVLGVNSAGDGKVLKYNDSGVLQWNNTISSGLYDYSATDISYYSNAVYVSVDAVTSSLDSKVVKYNAAGTLQWTYYESGEYGAYKLLVSNGSLFTTSASNSCDLNKINLATGVLEATYNYSDFRFDVIGEYYRSYSGVALTEGANNSILITGICSGYNGVLGSIGTVNICTPAVTVTITTPPGSSNNVCVGAPFALEATGAISNYSWHFSTQTGIMDYQVSFTNPNSASTTGYIGAATGGTNFVNIIAIGQDAYGCPDYDTVSYRSFYVPHITQPDFLRQVGPLGICPGGYVQMYPVVDFGSDHYVDLYRNGVYVDEFSGTTPITVTDTGSYYIIVDNGNCTDTSEVDKVYFLSTAIPPVSIGNDTTLCDDYALELDASEVFGYYAWSNGATTESITVYDGGTYSVTVTVPGCAPKTDAITITRLPNAKPDLGPDQSVCSSPGALLDAGPGFSVYSWLPGLGIYTQTCTVSNSGAYSVYVENANGCHNYDTINISARPSPQFKVSPDKTACSGSSTTISASVPFVYTDYFDFNEDVTSHSYTTSGTITNTAYDCLGNRSIVIGNSNASTAYVEITANVIAGTDSIRLLLNSYHYPGTTYDSVHITIDGVVFNKKYIGGFCNGNVLTFGGLASKTIDGIVVIRFSDTDASSGKAGASCLSSVYILSQKSSGNGNWTSIPSGFTSTSRNITVSPTVTTDYIYQYSDGTCASSDTVRVNVLITELGPDYNVCSGSTTLDAGSGYSSYLWSTGATTQTLTVSSAGTYSVTVNHPSCGSSTDAINVTFNAGTSVDLGPDLKGCEGGTVTLDAGSGFVSYLWSNGATTQTTTVTSGNTYGCTVVNSLGCTSVDYNYVLFYPVPVVNLGNDTTVCQGESIQLIAPFGAGEYTYLWSTGATTRYIYPTASGTYSVTCTHTSGCVGTDAITVTFVSPPSVNLGADRNVCVGTSVTLNAGTATSYYWSTGATTQTINPTTSGAYSVTITNANGCTDRDTVNITFNALPNVNLGTDISTCSGTTVTLDAGAATSYLWSTGVTTQSIHPTTSGAYSVTITNASGCTDRDTINVTFNALPAVNLGADKNVCDGTTVTLNAGSATSYLWSTGATSQTISPTSNGNYSVTITNSNGCTDRDTIAVTFKPNPSINLGSDQTICQGSNAILDAGSGYSYLWSNGATTQTITVSASGSYSVTATLNGCTGTDNINITVNALPVVNLGPDFTACNGSSVTLDAGAGADTYLWSTGATTQTISITVAGTYGVTVTKNGCSSSDAVTASFQSSLSIELGSDISSCAGNSIIINAGSGFSSYLWSTGSTSQSITVTAGGNYSVTVTSGSCPAANDNVNVIFHSLPNINLGSTVEGCGNATLDAGSGFSSYVWSTTATTQIISVVTSGTYIVSVTDANGCQNSDDVNVTIHSNPVADLGADVSGCSSITLQEYSGLSSLTYLWSTTETTPFITVTSTGNYSVTITDGNGCSGSDLVHAEVFSGFTLSSVVSNANCGSSNGTAEINVSGGAAPYGFVWSNGGTDSLANALAAGTYDVTVTDANNCTSNITVTVGANNVPSLILNHNNALCSGECNGNAMASVTGGSAPYTYLWGNSATNDTLNGLCAGWYTVTLTDNSGCVVTDSVQIMEPALLNATFVITDDTTGTPVQEGSITSTVNGGTAPYSYLWEGGETTPYLDNLLPGTYSVTITDANGCTFLTDVTVNEIIISGILAAQNGTFLQVMPNPSVDGVFKIKTDYSLSLINVYNVLGSLVYSSMPSENGLLNLIDLKPGMYSVQFITETKNTIVVKLIIEK